jgi:hypothetical protein
MAETTGMDRIYIPWQHEKAFFRLLACLFFLSSCTSTGGLADKAQVPNAPTTERPSARLTEGGSAIPAINFDDKDVIDDQDNQRSKVEVTVVARVKKLLPDDTRGLQHQKFLLNLSNGTTILIANDLTYGQRVPIQAGDVVKIHGEYVWNRLGGLIHWTHRSDTPRHESGWIEFNGQRYQ